MNLHVIGAFDALRWINRRGAPVAALVLLMGAGILAHRMALLHLQMMGTPSFPLGSAVAARVHFISYIDTHPWMILPYVAVFGLSLFWLQAREGPRWALWLTFALLALPVAGYMWICFRIGTIPLISL